MNAVRRYVVAKMVEVHWISRELAEFHVRAMDFEEVKIRLRMYRHTTQSESALAERLEGDAAQKTCAYGPREAKLAGQKWSDPTASWSAATEHEARPTFTSELGANEERPAEIPASAGKDFDVALGVGCALALPEPSEPMLVPGEFGGTMHPGPKMRQQCVPPQGAEGVGLTL